MPIIKVLKGAGALLAAIILFMVIASNFGASETRLVCPGEVRRAGQVANPATLYAQVEKYRWIIFWTDHDAMISWEVQPGSHLGFGYFNDSTFATPVTDLEATKTYGSFSSVSNRIYIQTSLDGEEVFDGICR